MPLIRGERVVPNEIAAQGGSVTHEFEARALGPERSVRTRYFIVENDPYVFENGTREMLEPAPPQTAPVTASFRRFTKSLRLTHVQGRPFPPSVEIFFDVQGFDAAGSPFMQPINGLPKRVRIRGAAAPFAAGVPLGLGAALRAARAARGLSQREAGRIAGLSVSTIGRVERGGRPSATSRARIEAFLEK